MVVSVLKDKSAGEQPILFEGSEHYAAPSVTSIDSLCTTPADSLRTTPVCTPVLRPTVGQVTPSAEEAAERAHSFSAQLSWLFSKEEAQLGEMDLVADDGDDGQGGEMDLIGNNGLENGRHGGEMDLVTRVFPERAFKVALREKLSAPRAGDGQASGHKTTDTDEDYDGLADDHARMSVALVCQRL
jgi:hypothetical protein